MAKKKQEEILGKYQPKKKQNLKVYEFVENKLSESGKESFRSCSTFNQFVVTKNKKKAKRIKGNNCKSRFCPLCAWRNACKNAMKIATMMEAIRIEQKKEFLFLTLTTPNSKGALVKQEIDRFNQAFTKLFKRRNVARAMKGYIRKLEMTYNKERDDYNPHFHVLLCVNKSYMTDTRTYITQKEWLRMWRDATKLPEITQVHLQKVTITREGNAVSEIAKYAAKDYEMVTNQEVFDVFYHGLKGRQLIVYGGLLKEYALKYEMGELDMYKTQDRHHYFYKLIAIWNPGVLKFNQEYVKLTEEEQIQYNHRFQTEMEIDDL